MNKYSKALLADAKQEYTNQLVSILTMPVYEGIKSIYEGALEVSNTNANGRNFLKTFQILLSQTPTWEQEKLDTEYLRIKKNTKCDYLEDLITAVFVAHTKILSSIRSNSQQKSIDLNIPTGSHFIHKVYIESARNFWKQPYLFNHKYNPLDLQRNLNDAEKIIKESILETVRKLLPVKDVLKEYLGSNFDEDNYSINHNDDVTSIVSENTKDNIRKLLKYEMDNTLLVSKDAKFSKMSINDDNSIDSNLLIDDKISINAEKPFNLDNTTKMENNIEKTIYDMKRSLTSSVDDTSSNVLSTTKENNQGDIEIGNNYRHGGGVEKKNIEGPTRASDVKSNVLEETPINIQITDKTSRSQQSITTQSVLNNKENNHSTTKATPENIEMEASSAMNEIEDDSTNIDIEALANTNEVSTVSIKSNITPSISSHFNDNATIVNRDAYSIRDNDDTESISRLIRKYDTITLHTKDKVLEESRSLVSKLNNPNVKKDMEKASQQTQYDNILSPDTFDNRSTSEISIKTNMTNDKKSISSTSSRRSIVETVPENFSFFQDAAEF